MSPSQRSGATKKLGPFAAVVFDLDGTLIHSAPDIAGALNVVLAECGHATFPVSDVYRLVGAGAKQLIIDAFAARGRALPDDESTALAARYLRAYERRGSPDTTLYPGVPETLTALSNAGLPLAVCTNKAEGISRDILRGFGLETVFASLVGGDSGYGRKPAPGPLHEACRRMNVDAARVLMVGDTSMDVGTAHANGAKVAVVRYGYSQIPVDDLDGNVIIDAFADLMTVTATA